MPTNPIISQIRIFVTALFSTLYYKDYPCSIREMRITRCTMSWYLVTIYFRVALSHLMEAKPDAPLFVCGSSTCVWISKKIFSHERISTRTRYENEAKGNSREWLPRFFKKYMWLSCFIYPCLVNYSLQRSPNNYILLIKASKRLSLFRKVVGRIMLRILLVLHQSSVVKSYIYILSGHLMSVSR